MSPDTAKTKKDQRAIRKSTAAAHERRSATTSLPERFRVEGDSLVLDGVSIGFQRTLRVGEEGVNWLPPSLGQFPLRAVDPVAHRLPEAVAARGGVLLPLYVREALWINLDSAEPVAVQIATGGVCIASGRPLKDRLTRRPQNYVVLPEQPWVDGFKTASGEVRQFVGVSKGSGLSVEQQLTGSDDVGGIQIQVWRLTPAALKRWKAQQRRTAHISYAMSHPMLVESTMLGVGAGGRIRQEIYRDPFTKDDWQRTPAARCWIHLVSATEWRSITGEVPPPTPVTPERYNAAGLPWFDYYDADADDLPTTDELASIKSIGELEGSDPDPEWVHPDGLPVIRYGDRRPRFVESGAWL